MGSILGGGGDIQTIEQVTSSGQDGSFILDLVKKLETATQSFAPEEDPVEAFLNQFTSGQQGPTTGADLGLGPIQDRLLTGRAGPAGTALGTVDSRLLPRQPAIPPTPGLPPILPPIFGGDDRPLGMGSGRLDLPLLRNRQLF